VKFRPGIFGVACAELSRYTEFTISLRSLALPRDSTIAYQSSVYVHENCNRLGEVLLADKKADWLCLMGDDHKFEPDFLLRLLKQMYANNLEVIVPLCLRRGFPFESVIFTGRDPEGGFKRLVELDGGGLKEVFAAGTAGMVIRRRVLERLEAPWFRHGDDIGEDVGFCLAAREAGFSIWADLDVHIGHLTSTCIWPAQHNGEWGVAFELVGGALFKPRSEF
jgi:hypothetical protein